MPTTHEDHWCPECEMPYAAMIVTEIDQGELAGWWVKPCTCGTTGVMLMKIDRGPS